MSLSHCVSIRIIDNKTIFLSCKFESDGIRLFGTTVQTSIAPNQSSSLVGDKNLTIYPEEGKEGVIAICVVRASSNQRWLYSPALLRIEWRKNTEGKFFPYIDLEECWVPANRICHVSGEGLEVVLGGKRFSTHNYRKEGAKGHRLDPLYVPDGNVICKYLFGTLHSSDVLHAAVQHTLEPTMRERVIELTEDLILEKKATMEMSNRLSQKCSEDINTRGQMIDLINRENDLTTQLGLKTQALKNLSVSMNDLLAILNKTPQWLRLPLIDNLITALNNAVKLT